MRSHYSRIITQNTGGIHEFHQSVTMSQVECETSVAALNISKKKKKKIQISKMIGKNSKKKKKHTKNSKKKKERKRKEEKNMMDNVI